jgi:hypothetical protein
VLEALGVEPRTELAAVAARALRRTWRIGTERAQDAGLRCRPIAETLADVRAWP